MIAYFKTLLSPSTVPGRFPFTIVMVNNSRTYVYMIFANIETLTIYCAWPILIHCHYGNNSITYT